MAEECFNKSADFNSLLLFYSSYGDRQGLQNVIEQAEEAGKFNVAFQASFALGNAEKCIEILIKANRTAEAALFANAYAPSKLNGLIDQWGKQLAGLKLPFAPENITADPAFEQKIALEKTLMEAAEE